MLQFIKDLIVTIKNLWHFNPAQDIEWDGRRYEDLIDNE